jgi:serine protease
MKAPSRDSVWTRALALGACLLAAPALAASGVKVLEPRLSTVKPTTPELDAETPVMRVVVKFQEGTRVRLRQGIIRALSTERDEDERGRMSRRGLTDGRLNSDLSAARRVMENARRWGTPARLFRQQEEALLAERKHLAEQLSGKEMADLDLYYEVPLEPGLKASEVEALLEQLNALDSVEIAYAEPVMEAASVSWEPGRTSGSASLEASQGYLNAAPKGIDARYAWTVPGGAGEGVKLVDVEGGWNTAHEDLPPLFYQGGTAFESVDWRRHGTAVLGVVAASTNGYGVSGIAHDAWVGGQGIASQSMASAIHHAAKAAGRGGVVLVELQAPGPRSGRKCACNTSQCGYVPLEYWRANFDAIAQATAQGVHVVEAAGNGGADLDDPIYRGAFDRSQRDSGAILVAGSAATGHTPMCWTNHGGRVDVHAWGEKVATLGYGDLAGSGENRAYTATFNGTSSAAPIVAGAVASLQGAALAAGKGAIAPRALREVLRATGTPQASGDRRLIGPQPNLRAALPRLLSR